MHACRSRASLGWGLMLGLAASVGAQTTAPAAPTATALTMQQRMQQMLEFIKTHYAKYEYRIPMRDGAKLFVSVYTPLAGAFKDTGPYPFLMTRTPYSCGPYGEDDAGAAGAEPGVCWRRVHLCVGMRAGGMRARVCFRR